MKRGYSGLIIRSGHGDKLFAKNGRTLAFCNFKLKNEDSNSFAQS
jgi:ribosomal protein L24E